MVLYSRAGPSNALSVPARGVGVLRRELHLYPISKINCHLSCNVSDRVALASDIRRPRELGIEGFEKSCHSLTTARRKFGYLSDGLGAGQRSPCEAPGLVTKCLTSCEKTVYLESMGPHRNNGSLASADPHQRRIGIDLFEILAYSDCFAD